MVGEQWFFLNIKSLNWKGVVLKKEHHPQKINQ